MARGDTSDGFAESSRRTPGPIRRGVWSRHWARRLSSPSSPGVMGPGVRRDDHRDRFWKDDTMQRLNPTGTLHIGSSELEYRMVGPLPDAAPTIVLLHEGLGSASLWGDFPDKLAASTGAGVFAYSRAGYGASSPVPLPRPLDYMHVEAMQVLPKVLDAIGFRRGLLLGHSDGASIAAIYAGGCEDHRVRGLGMIAPHFLVEDVSIRSIAQAKAAYEQGTLKVRLARWHRDVDNAFHGWNGAWLDPAFRDWD